MKAQPPFLTDDDADRAWHRSNDATCGQQLDEDDIKQQMAILQQILDQRKQMEANNDDQQNKRQPNLDPLDNQQYKRQPNPDPFASRVSRQGIKTNTSDKTGKNQPVQSKSPNQKFSHSGDVRGLKNQDISKKNQLADQSSSRNDQFFSAKQTKIFQHGLLTGEKTAQNNEHFDESDGDELTSEELAMWRKCSKATDKYEAIVILQPEAVRSSAEPNRALNSGRLTGQKTGVPRPPGDLESCRFALAPYDKQTLKSQVSRAKIIRENQRLESAKQSEPIPPQSTRKSHKRKTSNEFGGGTFWNRPSTTKRKPNPDLEALAAIEFSSASHDLIVDTGASHVLFQQKHIDLLTNVQLSQTGKNPFAILRAANGQVLTAIGKGIFRVKHIAVVAYVFRDEDLVHNLLGIAPFADCGGEAVFTSDAFRLYHGKTLLLAGNRYSANLWHISLNRGKNTTKTARLLKRATPPAQPVLLLNEDTRQNSKYVQFVHACMGSPPPTTFLNAVQKGYLAGAHQFPRLTARMVRQHMPNSEATARGHLSKTPTAQPHPDSQSVSARRRAHRLSQRTLRPKSEEPSPSKIVRFDPSTVPKSTTLHLDYTGRLPFRDSAGTMYFLVACWGSYIHLEPLASMKGTNTAAAIKKAVLFFRQRNVHLDTIRMDNQSSPE
jgi:hypothetical protein